MIWTYTPMRWTFIGALLALALVFADQSRAQTLTVPLPAGCTPTIVGASVVCSDVPPPPPPPPPPPGAISCAGYAQTLVVTLPWSPPFAVAYTTAFTTSTALVVKFTTPAAPVPPPTNGKGNVGTVEFSGPPAHRTGSLSLTPCDFTGGLAGPVSTAFSTDDPTEYFTFGYAKTGYVELAPNTTYYLNERTTGCSPGPDCNVKVTLTTP